MTQAELNEILEKHEMWLNGEDGGERADLNGADLHGADLYGADLNGADLHGADLYGADLRRANLHGADLRRANLHGADLSRADLSNSNLSGAEGLLSTIDYLAENFEISNEGYIVYKVFGLYNDPPETWDIKSGAIIEENVNSSRTADCGCGVNVATLDYIKKENKRNLPVWKLLIKWEWAAGIVVPYNTDGKFRCERAMLLEEVDIQ